jgi:hypothetical protein
MVLRSKTAGRSPRKAGEAHFLEISSFSPSNRTAAHLSGLLSTRAPRRGAHGSPVHVRPQQSRRPSTTARKSL